MFTAAVAPAASAFAGRRSDLLSYVNFLPTMTNFQRPALHSAASPGREWRKMEDLHPWPVKARSVFETVSASLVGFTFPEMAPPLGVAPSSHGVTTRPHAPCVQW